MGADIGISDRLTLGVELFSNLLPGIKYKYSSTSGGISSTYMEYEDSLSAYGFLGINLGLKYSF